MDSSNISGRDEEFERDCALKISQQKQPVAALLEPPGDATLIQVVGRHLHFDMVADRQPDPALAHFAADGRQDHVFVRQLHAEHSSGEDYRDHAFNFNMLFFLLVHSFISRKSAQTNHRAWQTIRRSEKRQKERGRYHPHPAP
jgi:hypothetical protein